MGGRHGPQDRSCLKYATRSPCCGIPRATTLHLRQMWLPLPFQLLEEEWAFLKSIYLFFQKAEKIWRGEGLWKGTREMGTEI